MDKGKAASRSIRKKYVTEESLEKAKSLVAAGQECEVRISSLQFIRFTDKCMTLYWVDMTRDWMKKALYTWRDLDVFSINQMLNNAVDWEVWL